MEEDRCACNILTGKPSGNRPLGKPRHRWEDNVRTDLKETGVNARNWVDSPQDVVFNLRVPYAMDLIN
jgi:hypothetical protein